jgi:hypothetical protein
MAQPTRLISDEWIEDALNYLATSSEQTAAARANRVRAEFNRKQTRARLILRSPESSVAMRDAWAEAHSDYASACEEEVIAVEADEWHRAQRNKCDAIIEAYRTEQASLRAGSKFQ